MLMELSGFQVHGQRLRQDPLCLIYALTQVVLQLVLFFGYICHNDCMPDFSLAQQFVNFLWVRHRLELTRLGKQFVILVLQLQVVLIFISSIPTALASSGVLQEPLSAPSLSTQCRLPSRFE